MTLPLLALGVFLQVAAPAAPQSPATSTRANDGGRQVTPVLFFPEPGMDDTAAYQGYATRFYRDSKSNTVQIYLDRRSGREVLLWADALDESAAFTARDSRGRAANLDWSAEAATVSDDSGGARSITYRLDAAAPSVTLGWFLLGTMRVERDFQYAHGHLRPFSAAPYIVAPESLLVANLARLPAAEQRGELSLLGATSVAELRSRLNPTITSHSSDSSWTVRIARPALDGKSHLSLELIGVPRETSARVLGRTVSIRARTGRTVHLTIRVTTDGTALTPLARDEIFSRDFLTFLAATKSSDSADRARRLEREVRSVELLSSNEKLMAGLPNYATYFGRDGMMTALMMRSIWTPSMSERVIASVLGKLAPSGDVSHEEALGEQAIREHADEYNARIEDYFRQSRSGDRARADSDLAAAREILRELRRTRENYHMMDDEFQLPVLEALYLADSAVPAERKRAFLHAQASSNGESHLTLMLREMALVATETQAFAQDPVATNLVSFVRRDSTHWQSASWRDSEVGYANGRFAMDINAIWAPRALQAIASALRSLHSLGFPAQALDSLTPEISRSPLGTWLTDSTPLHRSVESWQRARKLFIVALGPREVERRIRAKLASLPAAERRYWETTMAKQHVSEDSVVFLALSLDAGGTPIPVVNTDPATDLFLRNHAMNDADAQGISGEVLQEIEPFVRDYPVGLFVDSLGPVVANDAYASRAVWQMFEKDLYHSPRVVWGREVNLFLLGMADRIAAATDSTGRVADPSLAPNVGVLRTSLERVLSAVTASHLQHNEVWSYRISGGRLLPTRYGTSSDVQLWSTTDLAVQYALSRLGSGTSH
jgi:hypothetical protein